MADRARGMNDPLDPTYRIRFLAQQVKDYGRCPICGRIAFRKMSLYGGDPDQCQIAEGSRECQEWAATHNPKPPIRIERVGEKPR